jgi:precorrin-3B C17-methyltransferase
VTVAVSEKKTGAGNRQSDKQEVSAVPASRIPQGKIYVVGTGPGSIEHITPAARDAIRKSDSIVGYDTYLTLIGELLKNKNVFSTAMTQEIDRCRKAVELAIDGGTVTVISGGDPGIYAMAGLVLELLKKHGISQAALPEVEVIPGISAINACAARLGAPLMHDFAAISLSDRLTPWEFIEKRLDAAAKADFVIVLYNPKSRGRVEHISRAREIILKQRNPETPVGIVKGAMREDETIVITDLLNMLDHAIDMQTTVVIGNSQTFTWGKWMITPRGYERKLNT